MLLGVSESEKGLILPLDSGQLLCYWGKTKLRPFLQLILIIFCLIFENLVSQWVRIDVIDDFSHALDEFV